MKILVTGFGTWGSYTSNPSWDMLQNLPSSASGHQIYKGKISVVYSKIKSEVETLIKTHNPDLIISFGLSGSIMRPRTESYGWNYGASGRDADNIALNGLLSPSKESRVGYATTYNYNTISQWLSGSSFSSYESVDAGDFLCNAMIYYTGQVLESLGKNTPFLFIHVPEVRSMSLSQQEEFGKLIITKAVQENNQTIDLSGQSSTPEVPVDSVPNDKWVLLIDETISSDKLVTGEVTKYSRFKVVSEGKEQIVDVTGVRRRMLEVFDSQIVLTQMGESLFVRYLPVNSVGIQVFGELKEATSESPVAQPVESNNLLTNASQSNYNWRGNQITYNFAGATKAGTYEFKATINNQNNTTMNLKIINSKDNSSIKTFQLQPGENVVSVNWQITDLDSGDIKIEAPIGSYLINGGSAQYRLVN